MHGLNPGIKVYGIDYLSASSPERLLSMISLMTEYLTTSWLLGFFSFLGRMVLFLSSSGLFFLFSFYQGLSFAFDFPTSKDFSISQTKG